MLKDSPAKKPTEKNGEPMRPPFKFPWFQFIVALTLLWVWQDIWHSMNVKTIPYSEFKTLVDEGQIIEVEVASDIITGKAKPTESTSSENVADSQETSKAPWLFRTVRIEDSKLAEELANKAIKITGVRPSFLSQFLMAWLLPIALIVLFWTFLSRRLMAGKESMFGFGRFKSRNKPDADTGVTFNDVAGCDEAKFELQEVVDFLKNPDRYKAMGAMIPKGALLVGPPGTGKTLLARAVAGEANVPFFSISGSEFVEMFVGVGASRVRDLFTQAKKSAPAIIFLDEIDAIGRQRGVHMGVVNDEREQTLNQLLVELDGFEANTGVIVLAATNRPDVLDPALLRPGRFDRQVIIDAPDVVGRLAILKVHSRNKPLDDDADLEKIARITPGFSGADLANLLNEAALLSVRRKGTAISQMDLRDAVEKVITGPERRSRRLGDKERTIVAYHEIGHALMALKSKHGDPVEKVTIIPRGKAALGYTMQLPRDDRYLMSKSELLDRVRIALGGRAAEEVVFGEVTTGAENDLQNATNILRRMICAYGMGKAVGLSHCAEKEGNPFMGQGAFGNQRDCSEASARDIDLEVKETLENCYQDVIATLTSERKHLDELAQRLLEKETLDAKDLEAVLK